MKRLIIPRTSDAVLGDLPPLPPTYREDLQRQRARSVTIAVTPAVEKHGSRFLTILALLSGAAAIFATGGAAAYHIYGTRAEQTAAALQQARAQIVELERTGSQHSQAVGLTQKQLQDTQDALAQKEARTISYIEPI